MADHAPILTVPVSPLIATMEGTANVVLSLLGSAPVKNIALPQRPGPGLQYQMLDMTLTKTDISVVADLGFGPMFSLRVASHVYFFLTDLALTVDIPMSSEDSIISSARFGVGYRIAISAFDLDVKYTSSLGGLAAAASLNLGQTMYEVKAVGGGLPALQAIAPLISDISSKFDVAALETLAIVQNNLGNLYAAHRDKMIPQLMSVEIDVARMAKVLSRGSANAYQELIEGQSFSTVRAWLANNTLEEAERDRAQRWPAIRAEVVADYYRNVLGVSDTQRPRDIPEVAEKLRLIHWGGVS